MFELYSARIGGGIVTKLNVPLVEGRTVVSHFHVSPDSMHVVHWADQDTDGVRERFRVTLQAELKALFESPIPDAIVTGIALVRG